MTYIAWKVFFNYSLYSILFTW